MRGAPKNHLEKRDRNEPRVTEDDLRFVSTPPSESALITTIYPRWSSVLPLIIKGLLFPPLAGFYRRLYYKHNTPGYLAKSIRYAFATLATTPPNHPSLPFYKLRLAQDLKSRYNLSGDCVYLTSALLLQRTAISALPADHPDINWHREHLHESYSLQYRKNGDISILDILSKLEETALASLPSGSPGALWWKSSRSLTYQLRYARTGSPSDLELQISCCISAMEPLDPTSATFLQRASRLSSAYVSRFEHYRVMDDLVLALFWGHYSLQKHVSVDSAEDAVRRQVLAVAYDTRYQFLGLLSDVNKSLDLTEQSIHQVPPRNVVSLDSQLNLGTRFLNRGQATRSQQDLDMAIKWLSKVLESYDSSNPTWAICAGNLSAAHLSRYSLQHSRLEDLEYAVDFGVRCVKSLGDTHPKSAAFQHKLSTALYNRYIRHRDRKDLDAAIQWSRSAIALTQSTTKQCFERQNLLANLYLASYRHTGFVDHLDQALELLTAVVASSLLDGNEHAEAYMDLAAVYASVYKRRGGTENRDAIIRWNTAAVHVASSDNPRLKVFKYQLGLEHHNRYNRLRQEEDLDIALKWTSEALDLSPDDDPMRSSYYAALAAIYTERHNLSRSAEDEQEAFASYRKAAQSLHSNPSFIWGNINRWARFAEAKERTQESLDAYSAAFRILPELFWLGNDMKSRHEALVAFGINDATTKAVAVIMLNANELWRPSDALILLPGGSIAHVVLHNVSIQEAGNKVEELKKTLKTYGIQTRRSELSRAGRVRVLETGARDSGFQSLLDWLWSHVVSRIYEALKDRGIHDGRLWWCPTGPFTHLPLHAAGPPTDYIHSYISNLGSLIRSRSLPTVMDRRITAIGLSDFGIGGHAPLPSVKSEIASIEGVVGKENVLTLLNDKATLANSIQALSEASWLHLACHGEQGNNQDPLRSRIILFNNEHLDLQTIIATSIPSAEFAFLSACETATGDADMRNEALHLAGGMLFAGFKAAIGTLWSIHDADGPIVAQSVYSYLFAEGQRPSALRTAEALHLAIRDLRMRGAPPHRWAPFIHIGI
ncbi:hypothetical protein CVT24_012400 [Panaeolus cyanescens]|uniref:CHAT domain-containing protein n=1 Tax=Panaeolus cyanescens TaxID=181874 RepID=A0A409YJA0_9AGAR|nr:hypothetical protein CVT24_012400 [Panaeolus cyanescens]